MRSAFHTTLGCAVALFAVALSACAGNTGAAPSGSIPNTGPVSFLRTLTAAHPRSTGKISHVVIIFQENRSFDNLFQGFPGADTQSYGYTDSGTKVTLQPIGLETTWDIDHSSGAFFQACNGRGDIPGTACRMNGFNEESTGCYTDCPPNPQYGYVPPNESRLYFDIAKQYVLSDRTFASNFDASSFISHQYIIAGQASSAVDYPSNQWGCDGGSSDTVGTVMMRPPRQYGPEIQACFDYQTLGDELDNAGLPWRFYAGALDGDGNLWSAYQAVRHIRYGPDWSRSIISPQSRFFHDIASGHLAAVTWITPTCEHSDHAGCGSNTGPDWVATLVNSIGTSTFWDSTAVFVMWDDYGGWFDHVKPPYVSYDGLGMRVPMMIVSPYAKKGYVSHVQYEHGSILRFIEDQFGLGQLAASDSRATSPEADAFDFTQPPRAFVRFHARKSAADFEREPIDRRPPDDQ